MCIYRTTLVCVSHSGRLPDAAGQHERVDQHSAARLRERRGESALPRGIQVDRHAPFDRLHTDRLLCGQRQLDWQLECDELSLVHTYA